jgi:molybdopterin converting factor small subunit
MVKNPMGDMSSLEIEVIAGSTFGLEKLSSESAAMPSRLCLCLPNNSQAYTLRDLISALSSTDKRLEKLILDHKTGRVKGNTVILLNGTNMDLFSGLDTPLKADDRVAVIPFLAGG